MRTEFRDPRLEAAIEDKSKHQKDVAIEYARCMRYLLNRTDELPTWGYVNSLILRRWKSGLERVKKMAWDINTLPHDPDCSHPAGGCVRKNYCPPSEAA